MPDVLRRPAAPAWLRAWPIALAIFLLNTLPLAAARNVCDAAAERASSETGVPAEVLRTVTRVETGRPRDGQVQPWPWAINVAGAGHWFDHEDEALAFAFRQVKSGARNFDVGCFQINYRWHGEAFVSIEDMFDPYRNALYAARFLAELHGEFGNWEAAAGAYHSRTKKFADRYKARFRQIFAELDLPDDLGTGRTALLPRSAARPRTPQAPGSLIGAAPGGHRSAGSLVPLSGSGGALISFD